MDQVHQNAAVPIEKGKQLYIEEARRRAGGLSFTHLPSHCGSVSFLFFLEIESVFQDPCPALNGTRRVTMPQVLTRRREPITLLAKRGHLHLKPKNWLW